MAAELTNEEMEEVKNLLESGLMKKITPTHLEESLLEKGIVKRSVGGLVVTDLGHHSYYRRRK